MTKFQSIWTNNASNSLYLQGQWYTLLWILLLTGAVDNNRLVSVNNDTSWKF